MAIATPWRNNNFTRVWGLYCRWSIRRNQSTLHWIWSYIKDLRHSSNETVRWLEENHRTRNRSKQWGYCRCGDQRVWRKACAYRVVRRERSEVKEVDSSDDVWRGTLAWCRSLGTTGDPLLKPRTVLRCNANEIVCSSHYFFLLSWEIDRTSSSKRRRRWQGVISKAFDGARANSAGSRG